MARIFLSIGYDICFVVALVKTIRVAYIFTNVTPNKKVFQLNYDIGIITIMIYTFIPSPLESEGLAPLASLCLYHHD